MATFKVGQRVKIVIGHPDAYFAYPSMVGKETEITGPSFTAGGYVGYPTSASDVIGVRGVWEQCLIPLTDPKADAFLESIRKLKPYEEPKVGLNELEELEFGPCKFIEVKRNN